MHDARALLEMGAEAVRRLARRGYSLDLSALESLQSRRNQHIRSADELRAESKRVASEVQQTAKQGGDISKLKERAREIKEQIREIEAGSGTGGGGAPHAPPHHPEPARRQVAGRRLRGVRGRGPRVGTPPAFSFTPKDHVDLGEATGILDFARATKLSAPASPSREEPEPPLSGRSPRSSSTSTRGATATSSTRCRSWSRARP